MTYNPNDITATFAYIWRPGGTTLGNVLATWAEVTAVIASHSGTILIFVDSSIAPCVVDVGVWDCQDRVTFTAAIENGAGSGSSMSLPEGAVLLNPRLFTDALQVVTQANVTPNISLATGGILSFIRGASLVNNGAAPVVDVAPGNANIVAFVIGSSFQTTSGPLINLGAGSQAILPSFVGGAYTSDNVVTGPVGSTAVFLFDAGVGTPTPGTLPTNPGFFGTTIQQFVDNASFVAYTPAVPANWPVPPTQVAQALDELAAASSGVVVKTYLASQVNAIAVLQGGGFLPSTGTVAVTIEGFGGGGGGGGGGGVSNPGAGGGGARYQVATVLVDLTHAFDVTIGAGGAGGTAGTTTASGLTGADGGTSFLTDTTSNTVPVAFGGGSGGHGSSVAAGGLTLGGSDVSSLLQPDTNPTDGNAALQTNIIPHSSGFSAAGGWGQSSAQAFRSRPNTIAIDSTPAQPIPIGVPGGTFITGASGAGGGNGPRGSGGAGADGVNPQTGTTPGNPGGNAGANTGAGGGGGSPAGTGAPQQVGGAGGAGGTGWLRFTFNLSTQVAP